MTKLHFVLVSLLVLALACNKGEDATSTAAAAPASTPSAHLASFVDDYFNAAFEFEPSFGTGVGLHQYDGQLEDRSRARYEARIVELNQLKARLASLDRSLFNPDDEIDSVALEADINASLHNLQVMRTWETNPMGYAGLPGGAIDSLIKRNFAPPAERLRSVIARLQKIPAVYQAARQNLKNPPKEFTDLAIRMSGGSVGYFEGTVAEWAQQAAAGDAALLSEFDAANREAIEATRDFSSWLSSDLLPRSNGQYAIGAEAFLTKLKYEEMVDMPLAQLLAKGEAQLQKDYDAFIATAKLIDPKRSPAEVMASLSDEHPTAGSLVPSVRQTVDEARQYLIDKKIVTVPSEVRPNIEETPPFARSGGFASMDTPGPFETNASEAFYYVTPVEEEWDAKHKEEHLRLFNPYVVAMINVHEAYPGHYLQFLYAPRYPTKTRKLIFCGTNAEGWAHYAEQMMVDQGFGGGDPKFRLAQLQEALLRDARYVAGIKMHTEGWSVERASKELFEQKAFQEPANAYEEARRGAYNPTYLYYTLGKLQIQELRDEYMREKSATLQQFHDAFVAQGALPIPLVRRALLGK